TVHLALLSTRLPALVSERDEDPLFNDDWEASTFLYPKPPSSPSNTSTPAPSPPPITLLVVSVSRTAGGAGGEAAEAGDATILFDPSREELAVADAVVAISLGVLSPSSSSSSAAAASSAQEPRLSLLALRTIDPPSRLTAAGVPDRLNSTTPGSGTTSATNGGVGGAGGEVGGQDGAAVREKVRGGGSGGDGKDGGKDSVWYPPRGGLKRGSLARMVRLCVDGDGITKGVGWEVLEGLAGVGGGEGR
ncbi:hypothetical protein KC352_g20562, partial [Hortaea werneckii]